MSERQFDKHGRVDALLDKQIAFLEAQPKGQSYEAQFKIALQAYREITELAKEMQSELDAPVSSTRQSDLNACMFKGFCEAESKTLKDLEARVSATPRSIPAIGLFKEVGKQRDECADALRALAKVVEDNFPMPAGVHAGSPLDRARKALANVPTYEQRLRNIAEGIGMTYEELMAAMKNRSDDTGQKP